MLLHHLFIINTMNESKRQIVLTPGLGEKKQPLRQNP